MTEDEWPRTRILHEGGHQSIAKYITRSTENLMFINLFQFVLFGFMNNLASHLERSPLIHSYGYESAGDHPTCFASLPINPKSFMQYAG